MKKYFFLLIILFLFPMIATASKETKGTIKVIWGDYDNKMNERPSQFDVELLDLVSDERVTVTLKESDAKITRVNGQTTIWEVPVTLPMYDIEASYQSTSNEIDLKGYLYNEVASGGRIFEDGGTITLVYFKDINKTIKYNFHFNDGGQRDFHRFKDLTWIKMKATNSTEEYLLKCDYIDNNKDECQGEEYVHAYYSDSDKRPIWDDPINYEFTTYYQYGDIQFDIQPDLDNNKVDVYLNYTPMKINDVNIKLNFLNGHEKKLKVKLLNQKGITEREVELIDELVVKDLYKNMAVEKEIEYSLQLDDPEYTYEITGNQTDGFFINATYIEKKVSEKNDIIDNKKEEITKTNNITNPNTVDNILISIILCSLSFISIIVLKILKKRIIN